MLVYLNRGLIVEQALVKLIHDYFDSIHLDETYSNFHISVTNDHPFADLYTHEGLNAADSFPAVVVTTMDDSNESETMQMPDMVSQVGITLQDLEAITKTTEKYTTPKGKEKEREIPGLCMVISDESYKAIEETIEASGMAYGWSVRIFNTDSISIEIWAENNQLKNEIYKQLMLYCRGMLKHDLERHYSNFSTSIFKDRIKGQPSNNFNFDFDVALSGASITFDVNYWQEQILIDTDRKNINADLEMEVKNYVKETN